MANSPTTYADELLRRAYTALQSLDPKHPLLIPIFDQLSTLGYQLPPPAAYTNPRVPKR